MKASSAKAKGRKFQQYCRDKITELLKPYGIVAEDIKSTSMGAGGEDIQFSPLARNFLPISVECKSHKHFAVYNIYEQAQVNAGANEPVVMIKADRKKPLVVVDLDHYLELWKDRLNAD